MATGDGSSNVTVRCCAAALIPTLQSRALQSALRMDPPNRGWLGRWISRGVRRIASSVRPTFRLAQPRPGRVDCLAMGERIEYRDGRWVVPSHPIIPFIEGDGTGPDIWRAARRVFDATVRKVSGGKRQIDWLEVLAGEKAFKQVGSWLPDATLDAIRTHRVAIKGPLTTPVG